VKFNLWGFAIIHTLQSRDFPSPEINHVCKHPVVIAVSNVIIAIRQGRRSNLKICFPEHNKWLHSLDGITRQINKIIGELEN